MSCDHLYIGGYTQHDSSGIHCYRWSPESGKPTTVASAVTEHPSWLTLSRDCRMLYCVNETGGERPGGVSAFRIDRISGALTLLGRADSGADGPCHLTLSPDGRLAFVAHYDGGALSVLSIDRDGCPGVPVQFIDYRRHDPGRPSHPHCASVSPDSRYLFVTDPGHDCLHVYRLDQTADQPLEYQCTHDVPAGMGPRHLRFSRDGRFVWLIGENDGAMLVMHHREGKLTVYQRLVMSQASPQRTVHGGAAIALSPDGRFLYASNRGDFDEIVIFAVDLPTGALTHVDTVPSGGRHPRHFTLTPDGPHLLVGNQHSHEVAIFKRDRTSGLLTDSGRRLAIDSPACLLFLPSEQAPTIQSC